MTCRELMARIRPENVNGKFEGGVFGCSHDYDFFETMPKGCGRRKNPITCTECWGREVPNDILEEFLNTPEECEREIPEEDNYIIKEIVPEPPHILDSGNRREFDSGAVRDIQEGKGRCDLLPLDVVSRMYCESGYNCDICNVFSSISLFQGSGEIKHLFDAIFFAKIFEDIETMLLEMAKHFEEGSKKYGDNNWRLGIPVRCYIDSAIRHYLKYLRGDTDEPHNRAFIWNLMCAIWTCVNKPALNEYSLDAVGD